MSTSPSIRDNLTKHLDAKLVDELLKAHEESKKNFYLGGLRLNAVEGGLFCEAAFRILQLITTKSFIPLNRKLDIDKLITQLSNLPHNKFSDSIRLHIPRALRVVYDIRNNRDVAHLADGIDPNTQDATLVVSMLDWVLAEFVRLYHSVSPDEAQNIVENLVTRKAPAIQSFGGFLKVLRRDLKASDYVILLLYQCGSSGASFDNIRSWVKPIMVSNLKRTLDQLVNDKAFLHFDGKKYFITRKGQQEVESQRLYEIEN